MAAHERIHTEALVRVLALVVLLVLAVEDFSGASAEWLVTDENIPRR